MPSTLDVILDLARNNANLLVELQDRLETLETQRLNQRIKELDDRLDAQALDYQEKLTRLAQVVAELSTR